MDVRTLSNSRFEPYESFSTDFSSRKLTKNILRDDNSLLCSREKGKRNDSLMANMNVWIYFIHVLYEKQDEIICERQSDD